jgi:hypothetical protein
MEWLNLKLKDVRSPEFIGSSPVERSTWLSLLTYCVDQENGGVIVGGATWKDRQWQQTCGVTAREVRAATKLVRVHGEDIVVMFYPVEKERIVKQKREHGRSGGLASGEARAKHMVEPPRELLLEAYASTEGERKGKEKEKGNNPLPPKNVPTHPHALRIATLFGRRLSTPWSEKEVKAFKRLPKEIAEEDWQALERYYAAERAKGDAGVHRRDLYTFLNHFPGEMDRARARPARPVSTPQSRREADELAELKQRVRNIGEDNFREWLKAEYNREDIEEGYRRADVMKNFLETQKRGDAER